MGHGHYEYSAATRNAYWVSRVGLQFLRLCPRLNVSLAGYAPLSADRVRRRGSRDTLRLAIVLLRPAQALAHLPLHHFARASKFAV